MCVLYIIWSHVHTFMANYTFHNSFTGDLVKITSEDSFYFSMLYYAAMQKVLYRSFVLI